MRGFSFWVIGMISLVLLVLTFFVLRGAYTKYQQDKEIQAEIESMKQEVQMLASENEQLSEKIEYLKTPEFKERLAKEKLNYAKKGEELVVIKPDIMQQQDEEMEDVVLSPEEGSKDLPNYKKWWNTFFSHN